MMNKRKILVIGLDGATFDVLTPLIEQGKLPYLKMLMGNGTWGRLRSVIPPITGPAWACLATGKNPGKLGVYDYMVREGDALRLKPLTSDYIRGQALWDYLSEAGKRVAIINYPMLFPPYEVNGLMISGLGASENDDITFPRELKREISRIIGDNYRITVDFFDEKYTNNECIYLDDINRTLENKRKIVNHLLAQEDWDFFLVVLSETDWIQHYMWKHIDESHPLFNPEESKVYKPKFVEIWEKVDNMLGKFITLAGDDVNIVIISDHGFGPHNQCFNLSGWLIQKGYMKVKTSEAKAYSRFLRIIPRHRLRKIIPRFLFELARKKMKPNFLDCIDLEASKAIALGHTGPVGAIYINVDKSDGEAYQSLREDIISNLKELGKEIGKPIEIHKAEEIYSGDKICNAPDLIFTIDNWNCLIEEQSLDNWFFREIPYSPNLTGSHRMDGIFIAKGPDIISSSIEQANLIDIAPTLLYMYGINAPDDVDGKVLLDFFTPQYVESFPITTYLEPKGNREEIKKSKVDEDKVKERLKGLGYL